MKKQSRTSLLTRANNVARQEGTPAERIQTRLAMEWLLARIQHVAPDQFELKGGLALEIRLGMARSTTDIDLAWRAEPLGDWDELFWRVRELETENIDGLEFLIQSHKDHADIRAPWTEGQRFRVTCQIGGRRFGNPFGLDISWPVPDRDAIEHHDGELLKDKLGFRSNPVPITSPSRQVAEKLHAYTLPRDASNTRTKDLVDLALLTTLVFETEALRRVIQSTFTHRNSHPVPAHVPDPPETFIQGYETIRSRNPEIPWRSIEDVLAQVRAFLNPVLRGEAGTWDPEARAWFRS